MEELGRNVLKVGIGLEERVLPRLSLGHLSRNDGQLDRFHWSWNWEDLNIVGIVGSFLVILRTKVNSGKQKEL